MDWTLYWFMFPVGIAVATTAMLGGVGGAALFIPVFVLLFPALGPEYILTTPAAIGTALLTQVFGFLSGFIGYYRRGLIDFGTAATFLRISVPVAIAGALLFGIAQRYDAVLSGAYAILMLGLGVVLLRGRRLPADAASTDDASLRSLTDRRGNVYRYPAPRFGRVGAFYTGAGAFLTGFLGVGIGEVVVPQLVKRNRLPFAVAAATSVFTVIVTIVAASFTQIGALVDAGGLEAVPWNLVCYSVPGVLIGGQLGPYLQGRIPQPVMERLIGTLFGTIGLAIGWSVVRAAI